MGERVATTAGHLNLKGIDFGYFITIGKTIALKVIHDLYTSIPYAETGIYQKVIVGLIVAFLLYAIFWFWAHFIR